jgi:hypothetical protein
LVLALGCTVDDGSDEPDVHESPDVDASGAAIPVPDAAIPVPDAAIPVSDAVIPGADAADAAEPTPDAADAAPDAEPLPDAADPAPDAADPAPDAADPVPDAADPAPDAADPVQDAAIPVPDAADPVPDAADPVPDAAIPAPDAAEPMPDAADPAPDAADPAPDAADPAPDAAEPEPDAAEPEPRALESMVARGRGGVLEIEVQGTLPPGAHPARLQVGFLNAAGGLVQVNPEQHEVVFDPNHEILLYGYAFSTLDEADGRYAGLVTLVYEEMFDCQGVHDRAFAECEPFEDCPAEFALEGCERALNDFRFDVVGVEVLVIDDARVRSGLLSGPIEPPRIRAEGSPCRVGSLMAACGPGLVCAAPGAEAATVCVQPGRPVVRRVEAYYDPARSSLAARVFGTDAERDADRATVWLLDAAGDVIPAPGFGQTSAMQWRDLQWDGNDFSTSHGALLHGQFAGVTGIRVIVSDAQGLESAPLDAPTVPVPAADEGDPCDVDALFVHCAAGMACVDAPDGQARCAAEGDPSCPEEWPVVDLEPIRAGVALVDYTGSPLPPRVNSPGENGRCNHNDVDAPAVVFRFAAPQAARYEVDVTSWDVDLLVYARRECARVGVELGCTDSVLDGDGLDHNALSLVLAEGETIYLFVRASAARPVNPFELRVLWP